MNEQIKSYWPLNKNEIVIFLSFFAIFTLLFYSVRLIRFENPYSVKIENQLELYVDSKWSIQKLADELVLKKVIQSKDDFIWSSALVGFKTIKSGHYSFKAGNYRVKDFLPRLGTGIQDPISVTILPGLTLSKICFQLSTQFRFSFEEITTFMESENALSAIGIKPNEVLGRLHPETYSMFWTATPKQVIQELNSYTMKIVESNQLTNSSNLNSNEIITLASIVQWEAGNEEEKPIIAGLYLNRLRRKWKLQADPTVNFALGERRRLLFADYQFKHPYNTYLIKGLPPGPITNPDENSIKAVLNPAKHAYMYMVATPDGIHDFSKSYEEHQAKSQRWVKWLRQQYRIKKQNELRSAK